MPTHTERAPELTGSFARWARRVRARMALRGALSGVAIGLVAGAVGAGALWWTGHGTLRPWASALGVAGAAAGLVVARRRRLSDGEVALLLDARFGADEAIATALELDPAAPAYGAVATRARAALDAASPKRLRVPVWRATHAAVPVAALAIAFVSRAPLPPPKALPPPPPGAETVRLADLHGLDAIVHLADLDARDDAQRERLKKLADDAKKLREKLRSGVEKREAQAEIARLRDGITAERLSLAEGEHRQGLESAASKLGENPNLRNAARALGDRDLTDVDDEMRRLADTLEKKDRERAVKTLEEAAEAARKNGASDVAKALEEEKKLLEQEGKKADRLKELAKALGDQLSPEGKEALSDLGKTGDPKAERKLAQALDDALGKLDDAERKRLAEQLGKQLEQQGAAGGDAPDISKEDLRDLAKSLESPEGQKQLEDALKQMAKAPEPGSGEGQREQALDDAQNGAGETEQQLGGGAMPVPVAGGPQAGGSQPGSNQSGNDSGKAQPGHSEGGGPGDHAGKTEHVDGDGVRAKAGTRMNPGAPMPGVVLGRSTGHAGETANVQGTGALSAAAPDEIGGVEHSEVPEEYREQVGRYFQPK